MGASISRYLPTNQYDAAINAASPSAANPFATMADVTTAVGSYLPLAGGTMSGTIISGAIEALQVATEGWISLDGATGANGIWHTTLGSKLAVYASAELALSGTSVTVQTSGVSPNFTFNSTFLDAAVGSSIRFFEGSFNGQLLSATLSGIQSWALPDKSGTVALTSDVNALDLENVLSVDNQTGLYDIYFNDGRYAKFSDGGSFTVDFKGPATVTGSTKTITLPDTSGVVALSGESQPTSSTLATVLTNGATTGGTDITFTDADNMIFNATTGTQIGTATTQKLAFYGTTPVIQPTAMTSTLTSLTQAGTFTPDYAIQAMTNTSPYGFATLDEAETVLSVILNIQTRLDEAEDKLQSLGLFA